MPDEPSTQPDIDQEQLVHDHIVWMLKLAERLLGDRALAEDAVQDALFLRSGRSPGSRGVPV